MMKLSVLAVEFLQLRWMIYGCHVTIAKGGTILNVQKLRVKSEFLTLILWKLLLTHFVWLLF